MKQRTAVSFLFATPALAFTLFVFLGGAPAHGQSTSGFTLDREPPGPSSRKTPLVITEIMYNPRPLPGLDTNQTREFIEVYNSQPWAEDITGFSVDGSVHFIFPSNTVLNAGAYLVVARVPGLIQTNYGITNVLGPWDNATTNGLPTDAGTVQLRNRQGAVLLEVNYHDSPPWPEAADGAGHSLSLVRPTYGENDPRAWAESDTIGGSPGGPDPITHDPLATVFINEWQNHSDPEDWVELYNHSNQPVDMSGAWLTDTPLTNKFRIPDHTTIAARGFLMYTQSQLGFELFAGGETVFLINSNQDRVIDVIDFRGSSNNVASGRWPDGGPLMYAMSTNTPGAPNAVPRKYAVVINEIMYNPLSGLNDDEYVEIYNKSSTAVNISAWEFIVGITYTFPTNTPPMPPGAYWVVAKNPSVLFGIYTNLNTNNTFGPYSGTLANGGERIVLASADYDTVAQGGSNVVVKLNVPVSEVTYGDGGRWGNWSDGDGASLELIDPEADTRLPGNWADSSDSSESLWTDIEWTGPIGETLGAVVNDSLIIIMQDVSECLLDEVEVRADNGPNLVANGGFEDGLTGWSLQGSHDFSTIENTGFAGTKSLHVRAGSRGDNQSNRILSAPFTQPIPPTAHMVSIRAKAKWVRGFPEILLRLHGGGAEAFGSMALPRKLGTPGDVNSRHVANAGPGIYDVKHTPILPAADSPVVITARATDPQGVAALTVKYRIDPTSTYTDLVMVDNGTAGDEIAGDGIYSATIPAQPAGTTMAFYVEGRDRSGAISTFPTDVFPPAGLTRCWPNDAVTRECVVRWGEVQMPGDFATYHLWLTQGNSNRWASRNALDNTPMDGTFVYNNSRVVYNALPLYSGSPWHRTNSTTGPAGPNRVDYVMNFPSDEPMLGAHDFVLNNPGNPEIDVISDLSAMAEQTVNKIIDGMGPGLVHNHRRYIHFFVNGSQRSTAPNQRAGNFIFEDSQQPNGDMVAQWFPNATGGQLFKAEDWFEFENDGFNIEANNDADLTRRTILINGQPTLVPAPYRFMFRKRSVGTGSSANDYSLIFALIDAVSPPDDPTNSVIDPDLFATMADSEEWMRFFAVQRTVGNWDSYGWERGKNDYFYKPPGAGFTHMTWDIDYCMGLGRGPTEPLFFSNDPRVSAMFNTPVIVRAYWRAFSDLVNGPFTRENLDPFLDAHATALVANNVNIDPDAVAAIKTYITDRRNYLLSQLATVAAPFAVDGPATFDTSNNIVVFTGTAPVAVKQITLNGAIYPVTWVSATGFVMRVVLDSGTNALTLQGLDRFGAPIPADTYVVSANYTGPDPNPVGALIISEIMFNPSSPGAQFVEIMNRSDQNFDLSFWRLDGLNFSFSFGSIITNRQIIVLAQDRIAFKSAYGTVPVFQFFGGNLAAQGQGLVLVKPTSAGDQVINAVRYEVAPPWPGTTNGVSLQLIDAAQDNSRSSNWAIDPVARATPGASNSVAATLTPYDPIWLNELQLESVDGLLDNMGERDPWLELYNAGPTPVSLEGYYLTDNVTNGPNVSAFLTGSSIGPGEYQLLWVDGQPEQTTSTDFHTGFRLANHGALSLARMVGGQPQIVDYFKWGVVPANVSYGSVPDGQPIFRSILHQPTPRSTNTEPALALFINEWMAKNTAGIRDPADNQQDDWFEIYNAEPFPVDLGGFYMTDDPNLSTKYRVPTTGRYTVPANGFLLVWADNQTNENSMARSNLHVNFQLAASAGIIGLYAPDGTNAIDYITYGPQTADISEGRYSDGATNRYFMGKFTPSAGNSIVNDYNTAPKFPVVPTQIVTQRQTLSIAVRAYDPDAPPQVVSYTVVDGPPGVTNIIPGLVRWFVPTNQPYGDYPVTQQATDDGVPPRSDVVSFIVRVVAPANANTTGTPAPLIYFANLPPDGKFTLSFSTIAGRTYRVNYKNDLGDPAWLELDRDFVASGTTASITDFANVAHRFYQVVQVN